MRFKKYKNPLDEISLKIIHKRCDKLTVDCYNNNIKI